MNLPSSPPNFGITPAQIGPTRHHVFVSQNGVGAHVWLVADPPHEAWVHLAVGEDQKEAIAYARAALGQALEQLELLAVQEIRAEDRAEEERAANAGT